MKQAIMTAPGKIQLQDIAVPRRDRAKCCCASSASACAARTSTSTTASTPTPSIRSCRATNTRPRWRRWAAA